MSSDRQARPRCGVPCCGRSSADTTDSSSEAMVLGSSPTKWPRSGSGVLDEFVVLDVETTGLQPSRQRIIEIAIARFSGGAMTNRWESLCSPGRRVPAYIIKLTGIDDDLLEEAPAFEAIAETASSC